MIQSFRYKGLRRFYESGSLAGIQPQHAKRLRMQRAAKLGVAHSTLNRVLTGASGVSPEMALRLSKSLGRSPESWLAMQYSHDRWLAMQYSHDRWLARQQVDLSRVAKARLTAA